MGTRTTPPRAGLSTFLTSTQPDRRSADTAPAIRAGTGAPRGQSAGGHVDGCVLGGHLHTGGLARGGSQKALPSGNWPSPGLRLQELIPGDPVRPAPRRHRGPSQEGEPQSSQHPRMLQGQLSPQIQAPGADRQPLGCQVSASLRLWGRAECAHKSTSKVHGKQNSKIRFFSAKKKLKSVHSFMTLIFHQISENRLSAWISNFFCTKISVFRSRRFCGLSGVLPRHVLGRGAAEGSGS